jgi:hypothetical protein
LRNRHVSASVSFFSERTQFLKIFALELEFRFQPIAGAHFDEVMATKLPVEPRSPMAGLEEADRYWLRQVSA